jgi:hypothetical protein
LGSQHEAGAAAQPDWDGRAIRGIEQEMISSDFGEVRCDFVRRRLLARKQGI